MISERTLFVWGRGGGGNHPCLNYKLESCFGYQIFSWSSVNKYWQADLWSTWHSTDQQPPPQRVKDTFLKEQKAWFSSLLVYVDTGHLWRSWSHFQWASGRLVFLAENPFAMAAAIGTHGTVGVADLCQHSLTSTALVEASSRTPLERNKREMLYTLMTFPQWLSKTTASLKLLGTGWRRVHTAQQRKKNTESTVCPLCKASQKEGIIRSLSGMRPTGDSLSIVPTALPPFGCSSGSITRSCWDTLTTQTKVCASTCSNQAAGGRPL